MLFTHISKNLLSLTEKIFRQITILVISLVKVLLSRNFCQKRVRENSRNFHTVPHNVEITGILSHMHFYLAKLS